MAVLLSDATFDDLMRISVKVDGLSGDGVSNDLHNIRISQRQQKTVVPKAPPDRIGFFKLVASATKPGMYTANTINGATTQPVHSASSQLADSDFGTADTNTTVYLINVREESAAGHALSAATIPNKFFGFFRGYEADGKPIYAINECQ